MPQGLRINGAPKIAPGFSERTVSAEETLARATPIATAKGVTRLADITGLDRIGIPVFTAVVPKSDDTLTVYNGKGHSSIDARVGALMESIERQTALNTDVEIVAASYAHLCRSRPPAIDPHLFNHKLRDDYDGNGPTWWMHGYDLMAEETVLVPAALSGFGPRFANTCSPFVSYSSDGLASGNCLEEAVCHALCELLERDAWTLAELRSHWIPVARREAAGLATTECDDYDAYPRIDLSDAGGLIGGLMARFERAGLQPAVRDITSDFGIACVIASAVDYWVPGYPQAHSGLGAHPNARIAVVRALTELAQSRAVDIQGVREDILAADAPPKEHVRHTQRLKEVDHSCWMLQQEGFRRRFDDMRSVVHDDIADDLRWILSGLVEHGIQRVIVVDLSEPGGFAVVRVLVPGLEFWVTDHGKIGPRALQFWKRYAEAV
jgi:YcaO-like protein with predicted kinase domain